MPSHLKIAIIAGLLLIIIGLHFSRRHISRPARQFFTICLCLLALAFVILEALLSLSVGKTNQMHEDGLYARARIMGETLAKSRPEPKLVVVIMQKNLVDSRLGQKQLNGLQHGINGRSLDMRVLPVETSQIRGELFASILRKYPEADLVVSLMGMPSEVVTVPRFCLDDEEAKEDQASPPKQPLIGICQPLSDPYSIRLLHAGRLDALCFDRVNAAKANSLGEKPEYHAVFDALYVMLTRSNWLQELRQDGNLGRMVNILPLDKSEAKVDKDETPVNKDEEEMNRQLLDQEDIDKLQKAVPEDMPHIPEMPGLENQN